MIHIKLPYRMPTINHLYWHKNNKKILTKEAKKLREDIENECLEFLEYSDLYDGIPLQANIWIVEDWFNKDGSIKKIDIANREKFLIDSVFKGLMLDDKLLFSISMHKEQSKFTEEAIVQISPLDFMSTHQLAKNKAKHSIA